MLHCIIHIRRNVFEGKICIYILGYYVMLLICKNATYVHH